MNKIFALLVITTLVIGKVYSQDTLRVCASSPTLLANIYFNKFCPSAAPGLSSHKAILEGDTFSSIFNGYISTRTGGMMHVYCYPNSIASGVPDTSIFIIVLQRPQICAITSDPNNHPVIYIDSSSLIGNTSIALQRQITTTSWQTITNINLNDSLVITDLTANMVSQSYNYRIESDKGICIGGQFRTMHLQANGKNLTWNAGGGTGLNGYYIYKKNGLGTFTVIDSTPNLTYTDPNFQNGDEYFVEALKVDGCQSTAWRSAGEPLSVKSNRLKIDILGMEAIEPVLKYYVIGTTLNVELERATDIYISDITGRRIVQEHTDKYSVQLSRGLYIMSIGTKGYKILIH